MPGGDRRDACSQWSAVVNHLTHVEWRWVLMHLVNETARHAGHAPAARQLLDGTTGE
ncbi:MAG: mycothiol transferase [Acidimicrobiales bacterium]|jgi:hypothetical protein